MSLLNRKAGVQAVLLSKNNQSVLLVKRKDFPVWTLPGGRVEGRETVRKALIREVFEETGTRITIKAYLGAYKVFWFPPAGITDLFLCKSIGDKYRVGQEVSAVRFCPIDKLPITLLPYLRVRIQAALNSKKNF